jgi:hypothetical protein
MKAEVEGTTFKRRIPTHLVSTISLDLDLALRILEHHGGKSERQPDSVVANWNS